MERRGLMGSMTAVWGDKEQQVKRRGNGMKCLAGSTAGGVQVQVYAWPDHRAPLGRKGGVRAGRAGDLVKRGKVSPS